MDWYVAFLLALTALATGCGIGNRIFRKRRTAKSPWAVAAAVGCVVIISGMCVAGWPERVLAGEQPAAEAAEVAESAKTTSTAEEQPEAGSETDTVPGNKEAGGTESPDATDSQPAAEGAPAEKTPAAEEMPPTEEVPLAEEMPSAEEAPPGEKTPAAMEALAAEGTTPVEEASPAEPAAASEDIPLGEETVLAEAEEPERDWAAFTVTLAVAAGVIILPFFLGWYVSNRLRMREYYGKTVIVSFCFLAATVITVMGWPPRLGIDLRGGVILVYELAEELGGEGGPGGETEQEGQAAGPGQAKVDMDKLIAAVSRRVNPGGVKEVTIRQRGAEQLEIIVPEVDENEVARLERIVSSVGTLEFRILATKRRHESLQRRAEQFGYEPRTQAEKDKAQAWWVPLAKGKEECVGWPSPPDDIRDSVRTTERDGQERVEILVANDKFNVNGGYLTRVASDVDEQLRPCVSFTFNARGAQLFRGLTGNHLPDEAGNEYRLGIVLDRYLHSAPAIRTTIGQYGQITGDFSKEEVNELVSVLNAGSLPTALSDEPVSRLWTGPRLGQDTIEKGSIAICVSMVLVLVFMLFYYRFAGIVACMALVMNLFLILAVMITIKAAFTLPGIAGLVLTVGMAVDANVLIFERIREEIGKEAALRMAIRNGFSRATSAIVDANLTTLITATVLYIVGTDQVRGFAVTLWLGVVMSMFTAIYCSRLVFDIAERRRWITRLGMLHIVGHPKIDFLGKRRVWGTVSAVVILVGLVGVVTRGAGILDIDFTGGVSVEVLFDQPQEIGALRERLGHLPDLSVSDVQLRDEPANLRFMVNTSSPPGKNAEDHLAEVKEEIRKAFPTGLAHYTLEVKKESPTAEVSTPSEEPGNSEETGGPKTEDQSRAELPPDSMLASADPAAILLAQAETSEEPMTDEAAAPETEQPEAAPSAEPAVADEDTPAKEVEAEPADPGKQAPDETPEGPAESSTESGAGEATEPAPDKLVNKPAKEAPMEEAPAEAPTEAAADEPEGAGEPGGAAAPDEAKAPAEESEAGAGESAQETATLPEVDSDTGDELPPGAATFMLDFGTYKVNAETLQRRLEEKAESGEYVEPSVKFTVSSPSATYQEGDERSYGVWNVAIDAPPAKAEALLDAVKSELEGTPYFPSSNTIGGKVATSTRVQAVAALLASLFFIVAYIWIRFQRVMYGLAAVVALVHDVLITLGMIALSAYVAGFLGFLLIDEFKIGLPVLAAFLTIIGYSLNDTIVVFDRIREVRGKAPQLTQEMINTSINQTLSRTLLTSFTTLIVVLILYVGGGQGIHAFAFSLVIGVIVGTYSSIFVASPALLWMSRSARSRRS